MTDRLARYPERLDFWARIPRPIDVRYVDYNPNPNVNTDGAPGSPTPVDGSRLGTMYRSM